MKLAQALMERADLQKRLSELAQRMRQNAVCQEGETPAEEPQELLAQYRRTAAALEQLIVQINRANSRTVLADGTPMLEALAQRERLKAEQSALYDLAQAAVPEQSRYSRSEIKMLPAVDIKAIRRDADALAKAYRELDVLIQQANWLHDL